MRIRNKFIPFLFLVASAFLMKSFCHAMNSNYWVNCSTAILSGTKTITVLPNVVPGDTLGSIIVSTRSTGPEYLSVYDSSGMTTGRIIDTIQLSTGYPGIGSLGAVDEHIYNIRISSSLSYTKTGTNASATIYYHRIGQGGTCP